MKQTQCEYCNLLFNVPNKFPNYETCCCNKCKDFLDRFHNNELNDDVIYPDIVLPMIYFLIKKIMLEDRLVACVN